jgi:hypothetical protein
MGWRAFLVAATWAIMAGALIEPVLGQSQTAGPGAYALPGFDRVRCAPPFDKNLAVIWSAGYGYTEGVLEENDSHNRLQTQFGAALVPAPWLAAAARYDLRYDWHWVDGERDRGIAGQSTYVVQAGTQAMRALNVGGEAVVWLPSGLTQSKTLHAMSLDLNALATYLPNSSPLILSGRAGFRLDNSRYATGSDADRMSRADRLALGESDANALLLGAAIAWQLPAVAILGEWTWDVLVGSRAPKLLESPLRLEAGVHWPFSRYASLRGLLGVCPGARPPIAARGPLIPVEPRFWMTVGISFRLPWTAVLHTFSPQSGPRKADIAGKITDISGKPLAGAEVKLLDSPGLSTRTDAQGRFRLTAVPAGAHRLSVCAQRMQCQSVPLAVAERANPPVSVGLEPSVVTVSGVVLAPSGEPVAGATVRVGKGEGRRETITDAQGRYRFEDVPVGQEELTISATGWEEYTTSIRLTAASAPFASELRRPLPDGQIRGQVRSLGGARLSAAVSIEPLGQTLRTDAKGQFTVDVPPGDYQITVQAPGHHPQTKPVHVEHHGVTVLVIDLYRKRR